MPKSIPSIGISPSPNVQTATIFIVTPDRASQPWSNSWPIGEEAPILLAYLPSIASRVCPKNNPIAEIR